MYIQNFLPPTDEVLARALALPKAKPGADIETLMRAVGDTVAAMARDALEDELLGKLTETRVIYEMMNGEYEDLPEGDEGERARDDYSSGIDDAVESCLEPYNEYLSADWLGKNTIQTDLWEQTAVPALAKSAAKEVWKQLTYEKTPAQILANAGITKSDIETAAANRGAGKGEVTVANDIEAVIAKIKHHVGKDFDRMSVYDDLDMVCNEDDEILCNAAAARLGASEADVQTLQIAALDMEDAPAEIGQMIEDHKPEAAPKARAAAAAAKAEKADAAKNALPAAVFAALKTCGASDTTMAEAFGVSRSTYVNYCNGKTACVPDEIQYATVREELVTRANVLLEALSVMDGTELVQVA